MASGGRKIRSSLKDNVDEALRLFSERILWADLNLAESEFVLEEALKCYGSVQDGDLIAELFAFYRRYMGLADVARRQALLTRLVEFVSDGRQNRAMALLCFIASDTDGQIISGAALDLAMVLPADKDPLAGPKLVAMHSCGGLRELTGSKPSDDEGHAAAGLLLLGDPRLLPILKDIWGRLSTDARNNMIKRRGNIAYNAILEFLLYCLESDTDEAHFGELAAFLHDLPKIANKHSVGLVVDIRRNFGLPEGKEPMVLIGKETLSEAFNRIKPRLKALIERETEPKLLVSVYNVWALACAEDPDGWRSIPSHNDARKAQNVLDDVEKLADVMIASGLKDLKGQDQNQDSADSGGDVSAGFTGLVWFLHKIALWETYILIAVFVWALISTEWFFAVFLLIGFFVNAVRFGMMSIGEARAKRFALGLYSSLIAYSIYRLTRQGNGYELTESAEILYFASAGWGAAFLFLHFVCIDYAKQVRRTD